MIDEKIICLANKKTNDENKEKWDIFWRKTRLFIHHFLLNIIFSVSFLMRSHSCILIRFIHIMIGFTITELLTVDSSIITSVISLVATFSNDKSNAKIYTYYVIPRLMFYIIHLPLFVCSPSVSLFRNMMYWNLQLCALKFEYDKFKSKFSNH